MMQLIKRSFVAEFEVLEFDSLPNTMTKVLEYKSNTVVMTEDQTTAKGKGDRKWETFKGNLYFSFLLDAKNRSKDYSQLSFLSAIAMKKALLSLVNKNNVDIKCKWPNDVLLNQKKICGILLKLEEQKNQLIIGIGVNIKHFPKIAMYQASSIHQEGFKNITAQTLLEKFLLEFSYFYRIWNNRGFAKIREEWLKDAYKFKQKINIKFKNHNYAGIFKDLDQNGTLILKPEGEKIIKINSGDIF